MMYWEKCPDGCIARKLMRDWNEEEKALYARHKAFVKEADALGYVFRFDINTLKWVGRFASSPWVGLTDEEIYELFEDGLGFEKPKAIYSEIEAKLKEKNA